MAYWRVGFALLILGILVLSEKTTVPLLFLVFLCPLYIFLRPIDPEMMDHWPKTRSDGFPFYLVKWSAALAAGMVIGVVAIGMSLGQPPQAIMNFARENAIAIAVAPLIVTASWIHTGGQYKRWQEILAEHERLAAAKARKAARGSSKRKKRKK